MSYTFTNGNSGQTYSGQYTTSHVNVVLANCTCGAWMSVIPPPPCPVHFGPVQPGLLQPAPPQPPPHIFIDDWPNFYPDYYYEEELSIEDMVAGLKEIEEDLK